MKGLIAAVAVSAALAGGMSLGAPAEARADGLGACKDDLWITWQSTRRTICDQVVRSDGSWVREREFYTPSYWKPLRTSCYGSYYVSCSTTGGYQVPYRSQGVESYVVTPDTVLPDEPGHLG